jgi:hypothetical protein
MKINNSIEIFLSSYNEHVYAGVMQIRKIILENLPGILEQLDAPAKMIGYSYGQKYAEMICTLIPSKKGFKLGFYKGNELPDPEGLLEGTGKISRYIQFTENKQVNPSSIKKLLLQALAAYRDRSSN